MIRQKPANLLFAFAETSTEPPRASWGRSTRSHNDCRVRSPAGERQPPGARSISACFHSHEHCFQASVAFRPPTLLPSVSGRGTAYPSCLLVDRPLLLHDQSPYPLTWEDLLGRR